MACFGSFVTYLYSTQRSPCAPEYQTSAVPLR